MSSYTTQNDLVFNVLKEYYCSNNYENLNNILPIINGHDEVSLRLIDWFVTNYSKQNFTCYNVNNERFVVHTQYKLKLRSYKKKRFDPFCRWDRIIIPYQDDKYIQTTIGQLNFFKWANENNIIEYIKENKYNIENDMNKRNKNKNNKKRNELSIAAVKSIKKESVEITVTFS